MYQKNLHPKALTAYARLLYAGVERIKKYSPPKERKTKMTYVEKLILFTKALHYVRLVENQDRNSIAAASILEREFLQKIEKENLLKEFNDFIDGELPKGEEENEK